MFLDTADLKNKFVLFAKFGDKAADGSTIKLTQGTQNKITSPRHIKSYKSNFTL